MKTFSEPPKHGSQRVVRLSSLQLAPEASGHALQAPARARVSTGNSSNGPCFFFSTRGTQTKRSYSTVGSCSVQRIIPFILNYNLFDFLS